MVGRGRAALQRAVYEPSRRAGSTAVSAIAATEPLLLFLDLKRLGSAGELLQLDAGDGDFALIFSWRHEKRFIWTREAKSRSWLGLCGK